MDLGYLAETRFGATNPTAVIGLWSLIAAIFGAVLLHLFLYRRQLPRPVASINEGTFGSMLPIFNTASEVGYGATIAALSSFARIRDSLLGLAPSYPLISEALSINVLAGITGSASGGMSIALEALAESYLELAGAAGVSPELLHRVATMASGGFDTLPHNGAVITLLTICGMNHRRSYPDIAVVSVAGPFAAAALVVPARVAVRQFLRRVHMREDVAIVGAGLVGSAWALVFARAGSRVRLYDQDASQLAAAEARIAANAGEMVGHGLLEDAPSVLARIESRTGLEDAVAGASYVQESVFGTPRSSARSTASWMPPSAAKRSSAARHPEFRRRCSPRGSRARRAASSRIPSIRRMSSRWWRSVPRPGPIPPSWTGSGR